jgi:hypothetical protein
VPGSLRCGIELFRVNSEPTLTTALARSVIAVAEQPRWLGILFWILCGPLRILTS